MLLGLGCGSDAAATAPQRKHQEPHKPPPTIASLDLVTTNALIFTGQTVSVSQLILRAYDSTGAVVGSPTLDFKVPCQPQIRPCIWFQDGNNLTAPETEAHITLAIKASGGVGSGEGNGIQLDDRIRTDDPVLVDITAAYSLRSRPWQANWTCRYDPGVELDDDGVSVDSIRFRDMRSDLIIYAGAIWIPNFGGVALIGWNGTTLRYRADGGVDTIPTTTHTSVAAQAPDTLFLQAGYANLADPQHRDRWPAVLTQRDPFRYVGGNWCDADANAPGTVTMDEVVATTP
jgi:hypothetical protein